MTRTAKLVAVALAASLPAASPASAQAPPIPGYGYASPPYDDRPEPTHRAPRMALWLGGRLGYEAPIGDAYTDKASKHGVTERELVGGGPTLELDVGGRFGRGFLPFLFGAHTFAAKGSGAGVTSSSSNTLGFGLRYAFTRDAFGFVAELAYAYRITTASLADGTAIHAGAPGELRIGVGADLRVSRTFSLSPLVTFGVGSYSDVTAQAPGDRARNVIGDVAAHGYLGAALGAHFDLFGKE